MFDVDQCYSLSRDTKYVGDAPAESVIKITSALGAQRGAERGKKYNNSTGRIDMALQPANYLPDHSPNNSTDSTAHSIGDSDAPKYQEHVRRKCRHIKSAHLAALIDCGMSNEQIATYFGTRPASIARLRQKMKQQKSAS
ncbi:MAG: hypothetical protein AAFR16_04000 [Pseudomonadota bacterium]